MLNFMGEQYDWKTLTWACDQLKANNSQLKKTKRDLGQLAPEPAIWSYDAGRRIPCFDSCLLTIIWMSIIRLNTGYRLPHYNPGQKSLGQYCNIHIFLSFSRLPLKTVHHFPNFLPLLPPPTPPYTKLKLKSVPRLLSMIVWKRGGKKKGNFEGLLSL